MAYKLTRYGRISVRGTKKGTKETLKARTGSEMDADLLRFWEEIVSGGWGADHPYLLLLGMDPMDTPRLVERVEEGLSVRELEHLRENMGFSREEMAELVQIRPRTLYRRKK